ncbi:MAG: recombinase family protein [Nitrospiraceae bacterium]|nr:recombinase family protein [Nitrospiraceae bacterium]
MSGTTADRPEYQQMLKDAKTKAFDVLLVDDFSRLSRDSNEAEQTRRRLVYWKVRLIGCSDGIDTADKGHKMLAGFKGIMNEQFVSDLKDKISRGMVARRSAAITVGGGATATSSFPLRMRSRRTPTDARSVSPRS